MMPYVILSLSNCATKPLVINGYCNDYEPVVKEKGDGVALAAIPKLSVKKRILGNEQTYHGLCKDK
jgi:hypothetical protein